MNTFTKTAAAALLLAVGALIGTPSASADTSQFVNALSVSGMTDGGSRADDIALGLSICNTLSTTQNPNATVDSLVATGRHAQREANLWMAASVLYLCPQENYLVGAYVKPSPQQQIDAVCDFQCRLAQDHWNAITDNGTFRGPGWG